jgi:nucleoside-diphosphate-sugar epimerase
MYESVLVLGGTGFLGHALIKFLKLQGYRVTSLSLMSSNRYSKEADVEYLKADVLDRASLLTALEGHRFEYVVNAAGFVNHSKFFEGGSLVIESHLNGLMNILVSLEMASVKRFVNLGSVNEYGCIKVPFSEDASPAPETSYSFAKLASAELLQTLYRESGFPAVTLRLCLVYGEGQETNRLLPQIIEGCFNNEETQLSDGSKMRDFMHVDDLQAAVLAAMLEPRAEGTILNVASGKPLTIQEVALKIKSLIGQGKFCFGKHKGSSTEPKDSYVEINRANDILKWYPKVDIEIGLKRMISFYSR